MATIDPITYLNYLAYLTGPNPDMVRNETPKMSDNVLNTSAALPISGQHRPHFSPMTKLGLPIAVG